MSIASDSPQILKQPADVYHANHAAVSKSMLWEFWKRRRIYEGRYVLGTCPAKESTDAMDIGTLAHAGLLEPERFDDLYAVYPVEVLASNGAVSTKAAKDFRDDQQAAGRIVLKQQQFGIVQAMVDSVRTKLGKWLARPSQREESIYWTDEATGLPCKLRLDWRITTADTAHVLDIKTTDDASPKAFARKCEQFGYWMQQAHYSEGVKAATGLDVEFYFIAVETSFPFACTIQRLSEQQTGAALYARNQALAQLRECRETGNYAETWESEIIDINLRQFCFER